MGLFDLFSNDNEEQAARDRIAGYNAGYGQASGSINKGLGELKDYYGQALKYFQPLAGQANAGYGAYADATGANGQEGLARANALFQAQPGYASGLSTGLDALDRRAASRGMLASGNNTQDTLKFASDYANQKYGDYVGRLSPFLSGAAGLAGAQAGLTSGMGDKSLGVGQYLGDLGWKQQTGIGDANAAAELSKDQAGKNLLGLIGGGINLGSKLFGMM